MKVISRVRTLIGLGILGTFLWKLFRRRETSRQAALESATPAHEASPQQKDTSLLTDAAGASLDTARTASSVTVAATRTGVHGATSAAGWIRSRVQKARH